MSDPGSQRPPPGSYGRYRPPPMTRQTNPYPYDFMFAHYGNLEADFQEAAFVPDHGRAAFEAYMNHGTVPSTVFRTGSYLSFDNMSLRTINVTQPNEQAGLLGNRRARERYWAQQLEFNLNQWRRGNLGVIQIDKDRRVWGVALRCEMRWETLRQNANPPCLSLIWDNDLGEFSLYCSQSGDGHFVLSEDSV